MRRKPLCCGVSFFLILVACTGPHASEAVFDAEKVTAEIEAVLRTEVASFEAKDCAGALRFFADQDPLFVVSGRPMRSHADLEAACPRMTARFPDGASRPVASEYIYALSAESGYSVTEFRIPMGPGGQVVSQFVTKVWAKGDTGWQIVHVHESVAPPSP